MPLYINSELGKKISKVDSRTDSAKIRKINTKFGILYKSVKGLYIFKIKVLNANGELEMISGPIPLSEPPHDLAARYGSPLEMENIYMVQINYSGDSINRGTATIIRSLSTPNPGQEFEDTSSSNELAVKGAAYAPPGSGMI